MDTQYKLPKMEFTFHIQSTGIESKLNWVGDFTYQRPNIGERSLIDAFRARLNGDMRTIDPVIDYNNAVLAHLRYTLKKFPSWWEAANYGGSLFDSNVITEIYSKCMEFEKEWKEKVTGDATAVEVNNERIDPVGHQAAQI